MCAVSKCSHRLVADAGGTDSSTAGDGCAIYGQLHFTDVDSTGILILRADGRGAVRKDAAVSRQHGADSRCHGVDGEAPGGIGRVANTIGNAEFECVTAFRQCCSGLVANFAGGDRSAAADIDPVQQQAGFAYINAAFGILILRDDGWLGACHKDIHG